MVAANKYITRHPAGKGFTYYSEGIKVANKDKLRYLKSINIPPAWKEVKISINPNAKVLATGYDKAGRLQYIYHPRYRAQQEKEKFERILRFARALPKMRRATKRHLNRKRLDKKKVLAVIVQLMDRAYFRVGNESYTKNNNSYGITTIRSKHTRIKGDQVIFDFTGKSGQRQFKKINDRKLAKILKQLDEMPGHDIFRYYDASGKVQDITSQDVNEYIKEVMGDEFSAKDFRTWGGTLLAAAELANAEQAGSERERKKVVTQCVKRVARKLGNTPAIARGSYIDPRIIDAFVVNDDLAKVRKTVEKIQDKDGLSTDERCVLKLLEKST